MASAAKNSRRGLEATTSVKTRTAAKTTTSVKTVASAKIGTAIWKLPLELPWK